jgi:AbrB family looped-hinge helix DNA binding protein
MWRQPDGCGTDDGGCARLTTNTEGAGGDQPTLFLIGNSTVRKGRVLRSRKTNVLNRAFPPDRRKRLIVHQGFDPCYGKDRGCDTKKLMAKITSKYQVTVPKTIAERYNLRPGDHINWVAAGEVIRVIPPDKQAAPETPDSRLRLFDQATERLRRRPSARKTQRPRDRGWTREDLYGRGRSR